MRTWQFRPRTFPLALLIYCLISFGLLIPWLGFYWDDWPSIYYLHVLGPKGFIQAFAGDRPLLGWFFMLTSAIFGKSTLSWQIFGLLSRWLASLALWWVLRSLSPERPRQATLVAMLFAAYPGFLQQYIAVTYSHTWMVLAAFFLSLGTMILALRRRRWFWPLMALSWVISGACMFTDEYFFGLELLRPVILFIATDQKQVPGIARRIGLAILRWLPFLAIMGVFLYWRLVLHVSPRGQVQIFDKLSQSPFGTMLDMAEEVIQDMVEASLLAWGQVVDIPRHISQGMGPAALYGVVVLVTALLALLYLSGMLRSRDHQAQPAADRAWPLPAIAVGLFALLVGGIPYWVTNLPIDLRFPWDRFTLAMNLGASLVFAGLLELLFRRRWVYTLVIAGIIALSAGMHVQLANLYRREWNAQKSFFWQLVWRAPGIQPGTILLTAETPFTYYSDNSLTAPLNWTYAPDSSSLQMPYLFFNIESRLGGSLPELVPGQTIKENYRALSFQGSTSQVLAVYFDPPGCVKALDPATDAKTPQKPLYFSQVLPLSDLSLIQVDPDQPAHPPSNYFGAEPEHDWCYYFEKADLARVQGNWQEVVRLADEAFALNTRLYEVNAPELLPYIEGYAHQGDWDRAQELTQEAHRLTFRMQRILCDTWRRIAEQAESGEQGSQTVLMVQKQLKCPAP